MNEMVLEKDILLAEDDRDDVDIFDMALQEMDFPYVMRNAENGEVLFVMLKDRIPYILFLDIEMPCKDGMACIAEIRKNREYDNLPVIMYTSHLSEKIVEETFRSGANFYLTKTNTFKNLVSNLQKIFAIDWKSYMHYPPQNQFILS